MIALGCMRLSTSRDRDDDVALAVIRAALDAGITHFDTADAYCRDERDAGHSERLIARALADWGGDRSRIIVATKGGMRRPKGEWVADGRAKYLREACAASRRALSVETIELYQLHVVDPKTPLATSVRALAKLRDDGWVRDVGLCNVTVSQIREARAIVPVASVQVSLSPLDDVNLRNGVAEYCRDNGIRLLAHRPLGGERRNTLTRDLVLQTIAARHDASPEEIVLAWLSGFDGVVPIPGATRIETVASIARANSIRLGEPDRRELDDRFAGRLLRVPRAQRRPAPSAAGDVVIVMGAPGAGKTTIARELQAQGHERLNRDEIGGSLAGLVPRLDGLLASTRRNVVLDNSYPTRASRNEIIEAAWARGVPVRCIWMTTDTPSAQINSIRRMIAVHGSLPMPEEIRERSREDSRYLVPDAQFRYERTLEPPTTDEGFESVEERAFARTAEAGERRALILDFDELQAGGAPARNAVVGHLKEGWVILVHAWRPQIARGEATITEVQAGFAELQKAIGGEMDFALCPHDAGPPLCWCRKPIPGSVIEFAIRRGVALSRSMVVGASAADRTMAERIGASVGVLY